MSTLYPKLYSILNSNIVPNIATTNNYYNEVLLYDNVPSNSGTNTFNIDGVVQNVTWNVIKATYS
jgi:hypothetical protein